VVTEVEARVLETTGELAAARALRVGLSKVEPKNVAHRLALAVIDYRRERPDDARTAIDYISLNDLRNDPERLMAVAQLRAQLKMPDAIRFAYEARRAGFGSAETHLAYIGLFLRRDKAQDDALQKNVVEADCTVDLRDQNGASKVFTITDDPDLSRGEVAPGDPLARLLIGRRVGDQIVAKEGPLETLRYEVTNVRSKYVAAFQDSLLNFSTWFSGHDGFYRITVEGDDYSKVFFTVDQRNALANQVRDMYLSGNLTVGAMAHLLGTTQFVVWSGLVAERDGRLIADSGSRNELAQSLEGLANSPAVVLDSIALFTLSHLGIREHLTKLSSNLMVAQAVVDEIRESIDAELRWKGAGSMGKAGDRYVMQDFSDEFIDARVRFLKAIQEFIGSKTTIVGASAAVDLGTARFEEMHELLGKGAIASIFAAKDNNAVLISDDLKLREVARNGWNVSGIGTQALLMFLRRDGTLSEDEYHQHVGTLAIANYHFMLFDAPTLVWAIESDPTRIAPAIPALLRSLEDPQCCKRVTNPVHPNGPLAR
jgi:transcription elongation GreA/GreB family factor